MRTFIILFFIVFTAVIGVSQPKQFVCTPCGLECDSKVLDHGGTCASCGMALVDKSGVTFKNLSVDEICERINANPKLVLLDVRSPQEFNGSVTDIPSYGHFKNAININVNELDSRVKELAKYKNQEVIVYCSHSHRSPRATYFLSTQGFKNVSNMAGGVSTLAGQDNNGCLKKNFVVH